MKKTALVCVCCCILITSCAHLSPFLETDPYLSYCGKDGDFIFTQTSDVVIEKFNVSFSRITVSIDPLTNDYCGALEGSFAQGKVKAALNFSKQFKKISKNVWQENESKLQVMVPSNGIILFSTSDITDLYQKSYVGRTRTLPTDISYQLVNSYAGFIVKNPTVLPDIGFDISKEGIESFNYIIGTVDEGLASFTFDMNSEQFAQSLLKLIKASVVSQIRQKGQKVDTQQLNGILFSEGNTVYLKNQEYNSVMLDEIINSLMEAM